jgi:hypothetical protein
MWNDYDPYMMMGNSKKSKNLEVSRSIPIFAENAIKQGILKLADYFYKTLPPPGLWL